MTEPSPNSPGSHVSLSLSRCESSGKRNERKECPRIFLQGGRKTGRASATWDEVTKEVGTENERIRSYRGERGRVSQSVRLSVSSSSPPRSTILRHSRRGLITACHCCHGNSRSVKKSSALTPIVRLKFHGERVCVVHPGWSEWANICVLRHDVPLPMKCVQNATMTNSNL